MLVILEQLVMLFVFMLCGFLMGKKKLVKSDQTKVLSVIGIYMFLPCTVFNSFYNNFTVANITKYYRLILSGVAILCILVTVSYFVSKLLSKDSYPRKVFRYTLTISNYGYMGYALCQSLYGDVGLFYMILFALPFIFYTYTFGYSMLTNTKVSFKKAFNPILIALVIGAFFGVTAIKLPEIAETLVNKSASCMAPISMLLAGMTIAEFSVKDLVTDIKMYIVSILRLFVIPLLVLGALKFLTDDVNLVRSAVILCAMPSGLNTIVFPKLIGEDCRTGAKLAFISHIMALASIPLILNMI